MKAKTLLGTLLAAGSFIALAPAHAKCTVSSDVSGGVGLASVADVTLGGFAADGCDISGVNPQSGPLGDSNGFSDNFGTGWQMLSKVTGAHQTASFGGVNYTIDFSSTNTTAGTWNVKVNKAVTVDLVFAMHASNNSGAFFFDDQILPATNAGTSGTWTIKWLNNGSNIPDFSNLTVFARNQTVTTAVPEADTYAMLLAGLGVIGCVARRRKQA